VGLHVSGVHSVIGRTVALDPAVVLQSMNFSRVPPRCGAVVSALASCRSRPRQCDIAATKIEWLCRRAGRSAYVGVRFIHSLTKGQKGSTARPSVGALVRAKLRACRDPGLEAFLDLGVDQGEEAGAEPVDDEPGGSP